MYFEVLSLRNKKKAFASMGRCAGATADNRQPKAATDTFSNYTSPCWI